MDRWPPTHHFLRLTLCHHFHFLPSISLPVRSFYLFGHISISSKFTYTLIRRKETKKGRNKKKKPQRGENRKKKKQKLPINTSYIWILLVFFTTISSYFGRTIPLSTFHQHYLNIPKVEVSLLHFSKVNARFEWG